jgi:hypothetical protein
VLKNSIRKAVFLCFLTKLIYKMKKEILFVGCIIVVVGAIIISNQRKFIAIQNTMLKQTQQNQQQIIANQETIIKQSGYSIANQQKTMHLVNQTQNRVIVNQAQANQNQESIIANQKKMIDQNLRKNSQDKLAAESIKRVWENRTLAGFTLGVQA